MSVIQKQPDEVLVGLTHDRFGDEKVFTVPAKYWCSKCDVVTQFNLRVKEPPQFSFQIRKALTEACGPTVPYETDYCDLLCHKCGQPIRVKYGQHEFAMSSYRYFPLGVYLYEAAL
ncbi:hypothetical protein OPU71_20870 [Niveibacterium sp. 24ML]|uniref:hypothetical protein n=1 Tax=Niveibacterium sp. 24ML TaxID=2985512 RepID=UPI00226F9024|nr:hypothetical protein [Niveibacterium sp. 24ML]MCX9158573.1 hypothetical protein [Niveibacterium sp. 24ML]